MAAINVKYYEVTTEESTLSSGWTATSCRLISAYGNALVSGHEYLILAYGLINNDNSAIPTGVRLCNGTIGSPVVFPGCTENAESPAAAWSKSFFFMTKWISDGSDVFLQISGHSSGAGEINKQVLIAIDLDDLASTDWYYNENTTTQALATGWSSSNNASITFTPSQAGDWLVIASAQTQTVEASVGALTHASQLVRSGEASSSLPNCKREIEDANELLVPTLMRVFSLGANSNTFTQQSATTTTPNAGDDRLRSAVFALRLAVFADVSWAWTEGEIALDNTAFNTTVATVTHTPSVASQQAIAIMQGEFVPAGADRELLGRFIVDDTTELPGPSGWAGGRYCSSWDANDIIDFASLGGISLTAAAHTFDMEMYSTDTASGTSVKYRSLLVISPELAAGQDLIKVISETERC